MRSKALCRLDIGIGIEFLSHSEHEHLSPSSFLLCMQSKAFRYIEICWTREGAGIAKSVERRAGRPGFRFPARERKFLFFTVFRPVLGPTQPPIQWVPGALSPGAKRPGREPDHSPPTSAEINNGGAIPPLPHTVSWRAA
jgi:hypothetical protein